MQTTPEATTFFVQNGFPSFSTSVVQRGSTVYVFPDFRPTLYVAQWYLDVQRSLPWEALLTVGYIGTKGTHLANARNINLPRTPDAVLASNTRLARPEFSNVTLHQNDLNSSYQSLTAKVEKRFSKGLTLLSSFAWAHSIDQGNEDLFDGGGGAATVWNMRRERASSSLDRRLGYVLSSVYEIPLGKGHSYMSSGFANAIFGGWQVGGILARYTGLPIPHTINVNNENLGGSVRGDYLRNPNVASGNIDRWFDTGFVVPSAPGVISNAGRNLVRAPGRVNFDFMMARNFQMPWERHQLQFRFEAFNFTNTPNFGSPNAAVGSPAAGRITQASEPRRIQLALKYAF